MSLVEPKAADGSPGKRASMKFEEKAAAKGGKVDVGELQIENERIKTTLMILTQKLKLKEDDEKGETEKWQTQIKQL